MPVLMSHSQIIRRHIPREELVAALREFGDYILRDYFEEAQKRFENNNPDGLYITSIQAFIPAQEAMESIAEVLFERLVLEAQGDGLDRLR